MTVREYLNQQKRKRLMLSCWIPVLFFVPPVVGFATSEAVGIAFFFVGLACLAGIMFHLHRKRYFHCPFCGQKIAAAVFATHVKPTSHFHQLCMVAKEIKYCPCCAASIDQEMPKPAA